MTNSRVRVRFAPSPTGPLHMGGVRTALYSYLLARKHGGDFLLRIEDTDQTRYVPGAEEYIIEALKWCGIEPNEGVGFGDGPHAPYRQSERKPMYRQYAEQMVAEGNAYHAFDTPEEMDARRKEAEANKLTFSYDHSSRMSMKNSLTLSADEVAALKENGTPYTIRLKVPENEEITINDLIRGTVTFHSNIVDDKVLLKSDGMPTYHLAHIVDDLSCCGNIFLVWIKCPNGHISVYLQDPGLTGDVPIGAFDPDQKDISTTGYALVRCSAIPHREMHGLSSLNNHLPLPPNDK